MLSLFDEPSFPTIQGGIEFSLSKKISWYNEAGVKYRKVEAHISSIELSFDASKV